MAKIDLKFIDKYNDKSFIKVEFIDYCDSDDTNDIIVSLYDNDIGETNLIYFDKSTAIKFAKTLRTEINKISD